MKTVKPSRLSLLSRPYRWRGEDWLGVAVMALAGLEDEPRLYTEQDLWRTAAEEGDGALDLGIPKAEAEVFVHGRAYTAPSGQDRSCAVRMRVDTVDKSLLVFGDRYWLDGRITEPLPFEEMPLDWSRAFGGPGDPRNPAGRGAAVETLGSMSLRPLPNIEAPLERMESPAQRPAPAGFGPLPVDSPQRLALLGGRYDQRWLEQSFPGLPDDADWRYFNAAPPDQRWEGRDTLPARAGYAFWNMHPRRAVLSGSLPDWRARVFVRRADQADGLEEIGLRLTTACFFPGRERVALIWHGAVAVAEDDAADVAVIMPALEQAADAPRAQDHYRDTLARRLDPRHGALHALRDDDLAPRALYAGEGAALPDVEDRPLARRLREGRRRDRQAQREELAGLGLRPDDYLPPEDAPARPLTLDNLPERLIEQEREAERTRERLLAEREKMLADSDVRDFAKQSAMNLDAMGPEGEGGARGRFDPPALERQLRQADILQEPGGARARWAEDLRPELRDAYRHTAHLFDRAPSMTPLRARRTRRKVEALLRGSRDLSGLNLIGADLAGMDLAGARLSGAMMESANLRGAVLDGCDLTGAVLVGADLQGASLARAQLTRANLAAVRAGEASFEAADFTEANLQEADLAACGFRQARLVRTGLQKTRFADCDLRRAALEELMLLEVRLVRCDLGGSAWRQCLLIDPALEGASLQGATLDRVGFINARADAGVDFRGAAITASSFSGTSSLCGALFADAALSQCGFRGTALRGADLRGAKLSGCDFSGCDLSEARLDGAIAPDSLFIRADFTRASLRRAVLIDANLSKAVLTGTDMGQANLFRADVSQARIDGGASTAGAYTHGAKLWPARREPKP